MTRRLIAPPSRTGTVVVAVSWSPAASGSALLTSNASASSPLSGRVTRAPPTPAAAIASSTIASKPPHQHRNDSGVRLSPRSYAIPAPAPRTSMSRNRADQWAAVASESASATTATAMARRGLTIPRGSGLNGLWGGVEGVWGAGGVAAARVVRAPGGEWGGGGSGHGGGA